MTSLSTRYRASTAPATAAPTAAPAADEPTLITEQQVMLGTAAACARRPAQKGKKEKPARRQYPKRHAYLENALMGREMDRL